MADDPVFLARHYYDRGRALQNARELGVTRLRVFVNWAGVMGKQRESDQPPQDPYYHWGIYEDLIDAAAQAGIRVQLDLSGPAPRYATGDRELGMTRPDPAQFATFARAAAARFKGRVDRYSIWNEPNHDGWLRPSAEAPRLYRALYVAGYAAIKQADPKAAVLFGETAPYHGTRAMAPLTFLRRTLCLTTKYRVDRACLAGMPEGTRRGLRTDGYAHHPYDFRNPPTYKYKGADNVTMGTLSRLTTALGRAARAGALSGPKKRSAPFVYLTEFGYFATGPRAKIPEPQRTKYLPKAFALAQRNPRVKQMLHYSLVAPREGYAGSAFDFGLLHGDGNARPTYGALANWARDAMAKKQIAAPGGALSIPAAKPGAEPPGEPPPPDDPPLFPPIPFP
ncbi:MAG: cellulase family glycosylhydrolase [Actinomycetota bacterium]|nr:cellulase family glycosylhydrolase [Actinomycetota bacterium]